VSLAWKSRRRAAFEEICYVHFPAGKKTLGLDLPIILSIVALASSLAARRAIAKPYIGCMRNEDLWHQSGRVYARTPRSLLEHLHD
jgi:hypothetical protein